MSTPSNLYAEKVFSEQPLALWALDEETVIGSSVTLPSSIAISGNGIPAYSYGLDRILGYYITDGANVCSKNSGIPLVYGASNVTVLYPHIDPQSNPLPSLIVPGYGFLNATGQYRPLTLEMWLRVNSSSSTPFRIAGPISTTDGIYVDGSFLVIKVGNSIGSHYIGEWARPMLIDFTVATDTATLTINGDQVVSIDLEADLSLPDQYNSLNKNQDWIGFYVNNDISTIEIDAVAIYPYKVPDVVAKRRFVYGQGVEFPETTNTSYNGTSVFIDYPFANYTNNYNYPDIGKWEQGYSDNVEIKNGILSLPKYELPTIAFDNKTYSEWLTDLTASQLTYEDKELFISLNPNSSWTNTNGYVFFDKLNMLKENTAALFGIFETYNLSLEEQILFFIYNPTTGNYFSASVINSDLIYKLKYNTESPVEISPNTNTIEIVTGRNFFAGIDIDKLISNGGDLASFFGNRSQLNVYVGGSKEFSNTFRGNIYKIAFCSSKNLSEIKTMFDSVGIIYNPYIDTFGLYPDNREFDYSGGLYNSNLIDTLSGGTYNESFGNSDQVNFVNTLNQTITNHVASYTFIPYSYLNTFKVDVAAKAVWEDHIPLTYFGKYIKDTDGSQLFNLDYLQFNFNYPKPPLTSNGKYDFTNSYVKTYVSFQYVSDGANALPETFTSIETTPDSGIIYATTGWQNKKYQVVDNSVIYVPTDVDFNDLAIVIHVEINNPQSILNPINIKTLQIASQAINHKDPTPINTRFGIPVYPYSKNSNGDMNYEIVNPFTIYKGSSPYLYLTSNSGIELRGNYDSGINRGLSININSSLNESYIIGALQMAMRYEKNSFLTSKIKLFEIDNQTSLISFYLSPIVGTAKAKITAESIVDNISVEDTSVILFLNGIDSMIRVNDVVTSSGVEIDVKEWFMLGIQFGNKLQFPQGGVIRITGPILINNISQYQFTGTSSSQAVVLRTWNEAKQKTWEYWNTITSSTGQWIQLLDITTTISYNIDPAEVYRSYVGTNKFIIEDESLLKIENYQYKVYNSISWQSNTLNAV